MDARSAIREFILQNLTIFEDNVSFEDSDDIFKRGFVDSMFALKLVQFVESEFGLKVDNQDLQLSNFSTIDGMMKFIETKKGQ